MNRPYTFIAVLVSAILAAAAPAQVFNIDLDNISAGTPGQGVPASTYAALVNAGVWNSVRSGLSVATPLVDIAGRTTPVVITTTLSGASAGGYNAANTSGDCEKLIDDYTVLPAGATARYVISGLELGNYAVTMYGCNPFDGAARTTFTAQNVYSGADTYTVGGIIFPVNTIPASDACTFLVRVGTNARDITIDAAPSVGNGAVNGIQIALYQPEHYYINAAAPVGGDGYTWATAYRHLSAAMAAPVPLASYWVAAGTYYPTGSQTGTNRSDSFVLGDGLRLLGGFRGDETVSGQRDPHANVTILSGDIGTLGDDTDNSYHVVTTASTAGQNYVSGFIIRGGRASGPVADDQIGAGLLVTSQPPNLADCAFVDNVATNVGGGVGYGASATFQSNSIVRCTFIGNQAVNGGGCGPGSVYATYTSCTFLGNQTLGFSGNGGGVYLTFAEVLTNCVFSGNTAGHDGGAVYAFGTSPAYLVNCTLANNSAGHRGGGISLVQGRMGLYNCILRGNTDGDPATGTQDEQLAPISAAAGFYNVFYSLVQGWLNNIVSVATTGQNPQFVNALGPDGIAGTLDDDLRVQAGSPAIDSGNANPYGPASGDFANDVAGAPREVDDAQSPNTGVGNPAFLDRGAYEFQPIFCGSADFNGDGDVGTDADIEAFFACLAGNCCATCGTADFNADGDVGTDQDIEAFFRVLAGGTC